MRHIRELKTRWQIRFFDASRTPKEVSFSFQKHLYSKRQIEHLRNTLYVKRDEGWDPWTGILPSQDAPPETRMITVLQAVDAYSKHKRLRGQRGQRGGWSDRTYKKYLPTLRGFALFAGATRTASSLTTKDIERWIFRAGLSLEASRTYYRMLRTFTKWLQEEGYANVEVRADGFMSLHGREYQRLVDPTVDLAAERRTLGHASWIVPLDKPLPDWSP